jgi:glycerol-3-phosphate dehydrogenase
VHRLDVLYPVFAPDWLLKVRLGLTVFDWLAGARGPDAHTTLGPDEVRRALPGLRDPLAGAVRYPEYVTDDARLTLENVLSAASHGALVANHARAEWIFRNDAGHVTGARIRDTLDGTGYEVRARAVVNAGGPWAQTILEGSALPVPGPLRPSKGIHILLSADRLPIGGAAFLKSSSGRRGLAIRRLQYVYVGTSDEEYRGPLDAPCATRAEVVELLAMVQDCFPGANLGIEDVLATWAGVRPLIAEEGTSTRDTSREDQVWRGPPGLVTIAGGKLTTYRRMAGRVIEALRGELSPPPHDVDRTAAVALPGSPAEPVATFLEERRQRLAGAGVPPPAIERLCWLYGRQLDDLLALGAADSAWLAPLGTDLPAVRGEVKLAVEQEMAVTLTDFMDRRSALLLFSPNFGSTGVEEAAAIMGALLGWDAGRRVREIAGYRKAVAEREVPPT